MAPLDQLDEDIARMRGFMEKLLGSSWTGSSSERIRRSALSGSLHGRARPGILECRHVTFMNSNLETLNLTPAQLEALKNGGRLDMWGGNPDGDRGNSAAAKPVSNKSKKRSSFTSSRKLWWTRSFKQITRRPGHWWPRFTRAGTKISRNETRSN